MKKIVTCLLFSFLLVTSSSGQCQYNLDSYTHNDCFGDNSGSINLTLSNPNSTIQWSGPNSFISNNIDINNLFAGTYYLTITNLIEGCTSSDSIIIQETNKISADFVLDGRCSELDSIDVFATLFGGTPPYSSVWDNGSIGPNVINLPPNGSNLRVLTVTDANFCVDTVHLLLNNFNSMSSLMSSVGVICKDDNSGEARVLIEGGTAPYNFYWSNNQEHLTEQNNFSTIYNLYPDLYFVEVVDNMGCILIDTIEVKSNPGTCINVFKAFSPNDDDVNEFWEIENIHLYPKAVVSVYDRNGTEVFRRRNYINAENEAFGGKDYLGNPLPSTSYYYVIDLQNGDDVFKGVITILR